MTNQERKIESALEGWFLLEGWSIDQHVAEWTHNSNGLTYTTSVDLTDLAQHVAREAELC